MAITYDYEVSRWSASQSVERRVDTWEDAIRIAHELVAAWPHNPEEEWDDIVVTPATSATTVSGSAASGGTSAAPPRESNAPIPTHPLSGWAVLG
jgi:hypothetical protein